MAEPCSDRKKPEYKTTQIFLIRPTHNIRPTAIKDLWRSSSVFLHDKVTITNTMSLATYLQKKNPKTTQTSKTPQCFLN